jgi:integrase
LTLADGKALCIDVACPGIDVEVGVVEEIVEFRAGLECHSLLGQREIPLGEELLECLKSQLRLRNNTVPDCPLVFFRILRTKENPVPSWVPIGDFRKVWETACAKCGLVGLLIHDLRRAAVRNLLRAGVQEQVAMKLSGHLTRAIFARYNIVSEQDLTDAVRKLQRFQEAAEPACPPAQVGPSVSPAQSALVN